MEVESIAPSVSPTVTAGAKNYLYLSVWECLYIVFVPKTVISSIQICQRCKG